jgi:transcriptional regulator with XRE-family HTH domain
VKKSKRERLKAAGWAVGGVQEFLGLSDAEAALIEIKLSLSRSLHDRRQQRGLSQVELAKRLHSSQSRVAKMEAGDPSVSMDLLVSALLVLGASSADLARAVRCNEGSVFEDDPGLKLKIESAYADYQTHGGISSEAILTRLKRKRAAGKG